MVRGTPVLDLEISFTGFQLTPLNFHICRMDPSPPLLFGAPIYFECEHEDGLILGLAVVYTKCSSTVCVDVRFLEWIPHRFVTWYWNLNGVGWLIEGL